MNLVTNPQDVNYKLEAAVGRGYMSAVDDSVPKNVSAENYVQACVLVIMTIVWKITY
jgi:hypothetical protein